MTLLTLALSKHFGVFVLQSSVSSLTAYIIMFIFSVQWDNKAGFALGSSTQ